MRRKQFTFYESFYETIQCIGTKAQRADAYDAICAYALRGEEPDMERLSPSVKIVMKSCRPVLFAANKKAMAAKKGAENRGGTAGKAEDRPAPNWQPKPKKKVPVCSGELGEAEMAAIQKMLAE